MGINNYLMIKCAAGPDKSKKDKKTRIADHNAFGVRTTGYPLNYNPSQVLQDALDYTGLSNSKRIREGLSGHAIGVLEPEGVVNAIENTTDHPQQRQEVLLRNPVTLPVDSATGRLNTNTVRSKDRALAYGLTGAGIGGLGGLIGSTMLANRIGLGKDKDGNISTNRLYARRALQLLSALGIGAGGYYLGSNIGGRPIALQQARAGHARTWYHPWTTPARAADPRVVPTETIEGLPVRSTDLLTDNAENAYNEEVSHGTII